MQLDKLWTISTVRHHLKDGVAPTVTEGQVLLQIIDVLVSGREDQLPTERAANQRSLLAAHHALWLTLMWLGLHVEGYVRNDRYGEQLEWMYRWDLGDDTGPFEPAAQAVEHALRMRLGQPCYEDWL